MIARASADGRRERLLDQHVHARARRARAPPSRCSSVGTATIAKSGRPALEQLADDAEDQRRGRATAP